MNFQSSLYFGTNSAKKPSKPINQKLLLYLKALPSVYKNYLKSLNQKRSTRNDVFEVPSNEKFFVELYNMNNITQLTRDQLYNIHILKNQAWKFESLEAAIKIKPNTKGSFKSNLPLLSEPRARYFEVTIKKLLSTTVLSIGFTANYYPNQYLPGQQPYSVGYYSVDGKLRINQRENDQILSLISFQEGDVVGCGLNKYNNVFFTLNGKLIDNTQYPSFDFEAYPCIGYLNSTHETILDLSINFGTSDFFYFDANYYEMAMFAPEHTVHHHNIQHNTYSIQTLLTSNNNFLLPSYNGYTNFPVLEAEPPIFTP